jgi:hypothetical protein
MKKSLIIGVFISVLLIGVAVAQLIDFNNYSYQGFVTRNNAGEVIKIEANVTLGGETTLISCPIIEYKECKVSNIGVEEVKRDARCGADTVEETVRICVENYVNGLEEESTGAVEVLSEVQVTG